MVNFTIGLLHSTGTIVSGNATFYVLLFVTFHDEFSGPRDVTIAISAISFVLVFLSLLLIYAARRLRRNLLIPWLLAKLFERCFVAVFIAEGLVHDDLGVIAITMILLGISIRCLVRQTASALTQLALFSTVFAFYLWWVVCCYYVQLKQGHPGNCSSYPSRQVSVEETEA